MKFERLRLDEVNWKELDSFPDRTVFQTLPWLEFVCEAQGGEIVIAALQDKGKLVGYFTGVMVKRYGVLILGSPFRGWTTSYMGFNLLSGISRLEALIALEEFAFKSLRCIHLEIMDRRFNPAEIVDYTFDQMSGYEVDITLSEDELFKGMSSSCRRCIRKAEKNGVLIEEAFMEDFVDDYFAQLKDVFAKQGLVPTYKRQRVEVLIKHLYSTGNLLLLRAKDQSEKCIATGIFPGFNDSYYFWGGASWRESQNLRPNEAIQWYAMRYWKSRGISRFDMGGGGDYKEKYGGQRISVPWVRKSKYNAIGSMRDLAKRAIKISQKFAGRKER